MSMIRTLCCCLLLLTGCANIQTATRSEGHTTPNDAFLVEVTDVMPGAPFSFVSVSTLRPGRVGELPERLTEAQVASMTAAAAEQGAEVLVTERIDNRRQTVFYGFGLQRTEPPGAGLAGVTMCRQPSLSTTVSRAVKKTNRCLKQLQATRSSLQGTVRTIILVDGFGDAYQAAVAPDSTRDGMMAACGLNAAHAVNFGAHDEVLCRLEIEASL
jgi:hypothetical protein